MSREGAGAGTQEHTRPAGTPMWIGVLYFLGAVGAIALGFLLGMKLVESVFWDDAPAYDVSLPLVVLWGGLFVAAAVVWVARRNR